MAQTNFLSPINFVFKLDILPNTQYNVQHVTIPGMTLGVAETASPFVKIFNPGNVQYEPVEVTFKVGENMSDYLEIFNWMVSLGHPDSLAQFQNIKSDASIIILNSAKNPSMNIRFTDCFPISLSPLEMNTTLEDVQYVTARAAFKFQRFYYEPRS